MRQPIELWAQITAALHCVNQGEFVYLIVDDDELEEAKKLIGTRTEILAVTREQAHALHLTA